VRRVFLVLAAALGAFALVPPALAAPAVTTIELPRSGPRTFELPRGAHRFTLAGVHWRGSGSVELRTRSTGGRWSAWREAAPEDEDGPDAGAREHGPRGWRIGNPWWVGESNRLEVRVRGQVGRVRAHLVWSPETRIPLRVPAATVAPPIVPRSTWGADERIRRAPPSYATDVRVAIVHHTAGRNGYSRAEAAAMVKGIQLFHVQGNGWNDVGYNFLVDRFGTIYEGRFGGVDRNVIGAHAQGFNTGSVGIALLGTYGDSNPPPAAAQDAIARLIAWRLDVAHVDPASSLTFASGGSDRYPSGLPVILDAVSGHRDTGRTECPGDALYARLSAIAAAARGLGGPKIFEPKAEIAAGVVRVRARLSHSQAWTVTISDSEGVEVARGAGSGTTVDWTWSSAGAPAGSYVWTISSGAARPATGILRAGGGATPLAIETLETEPAVISPNGDGQADTTAVSYRITAAANVTVEVADATGAVVATVVDRVWTRAGEHAVTIDGAALPDGSYDVVVTARTPAGVSARRSVPLSVNRALGIVSVSPGVFSPNADGRMDRLTVGFELAAPADVRVLVEREGRWVATPLVGTLPIGTQRFVWDGARASGVLRDGVYRAIVEATTASGTISYGVDFGVDRVAPRVRIVAGRVLRVEVSEPATLTALIDGRPWRRVVRKAGAVRLPSGAAARRVRVVAWDAAGNSSGPVLWAARG
jgi:hypothetical protein